MEIKKYCEERDYENVLSSVIEENWQSFYEERKEEYKISLKSSITYVIYDNGFCGFLRALTDGLFTLFIAEIVIVKNKRMNGYGKHLIEYVHNLYPSTRIDLISEEDLFYNKIGFKPLGTGMRKHNWY